MSLNAEALPPCALQIEAQRLHVERRQRLGDGIYSKYAQTVSRLFEAEQKLETVQLRIKESEGLLERVRLEAALAIAMRPPRPTAGVTIKAVIAHVAAHYGMEPSEIIGTRRTWDVVIPRHVAMYIGKKLTSRSFPEIGRQIGGRDHSTVLYACRKIAKMVDEDAEIRGIVDKIVDGLVVKND